MTEFIRTLANAIWTPVLFLLILGGLFFFFYSRFIPYKYFRHAINILRGKYDNPNDPGYINAYQALSTALASTVGMGNIAGVAYAISIGGPGALFWMWITAFVGMSSNFFTSSLAVMYRGRDSQGNLQGGPMYVIREALAKRWHWLAVVFSACCLIGCLPIFQANQLTQAIREIGFQNYDLGTLRILSTEISVFNLITGIILTLIAGIVILGGIERIGNWAGRMVPLMIVLYFISVLFILFVHIESVPHYLWLIVTDAFKGEFYKGPLFGGVLGGLILTGVRRASFSSEAGIGTAPLALGASKSREPIREGLVSMLSPAVDTLVVCTLTALAILVTDVWQTSKTNGVTLTATAFESTIPYAGKYLLLICAFFFAVTSLFSYCYYGSKSMAFLVGVKYGWYYNYFYLATIIFGAVVKMETVINIIDIAYAAMAFPTMISGFILAPRVMEEARRYFNALKQKK
jgi:AGCS family alanine or glycine:cation symporter